jgi:hypothetical protein
MIDDSEAGRVPDPSRLLFRRQFLLGPEPFAPSEHWSHVALRHGLHLSVHTDLPFVRSEDESATRVLLGVAVDALEPGRTEAEMLARLSTGAPDLASAIDQTTSLAGRWVVIQQDRSNTYLFTDPCSFRQVYYHSDGDRTWCGSRPEIIDAAHPLTAATGADLVDFVSSAQHTRRRFAWIGDTTPYAGCFHLMANHYLSIDPLSTARFYPSHSIAARSDTDVIDMAVPMLQGLVAGLACRHDVCLAVTAGWESRVLLAASRAVRSDIEYFVYGDGLVPSGGADSWVPQELSRRLGLGLVLRSCTQEAPAWFTSALRRNNSGGRVAGQTRTVWDKFKRDEQRLNINGNASEICRSHYDRFSRRSARDVTGPDLAGLMGYRGVPFAENELERWRDGVNDRASDALTVLDLLYWEQRLGNRGAQYPAEQDIACDEFSPFNCRLLLETLASAPRRSRIEPAYTLYRGLVERMWPETLAVPVNPPAKGDALGRARKLIRPLIPEPLVDAAKRVLGR